MRGGRSNLLRRFVAAGAALALGLGLLTAGAATASAAPTAGLTATVLRGDTPLKENDVINEGDALKLRVQYDGAAKPPLAGQTVTFKLGSNVTLSGDLKDNVAIESIALGTEPGTVVVTFKSPWPSSVGQGFFDLDFTVNSVDDTSKEDLSWEIGDEKYSFPIVIKNDGDDFENVKEDYKKSAAPGNLNKFVEVADDAAGVTQFVRLKDTIADEVITYTLTVNSPKGMARTGFDISDVLDAGLGYVAGSFAAELTTWDTDGYNKATNAFTFDPTIAGQTFAETVDLPEASVLTVTYQVKVTDKALLETALRAKFDAMKGDSGDFKIAVNNTVGFGDDKANERSAAIGIKGDVPGPGVGKAFTKVGSWVDATLITDENGAIVDEAGVPAPVEITYTLGANLGQWDGHNKNFTLDRNVVIEDVLSPSATWKAGLSDFISMTGSSPDFTQLTNAGTCVGTVANFAAAEFVGKYCVDGQTLRINVGKHVDTNVGIAAKAQLNTVEGLDVSGTSSIEGSTRYLLPNTATFTYRDGNGHNANWNSYPVVLPDERSEGLNDPEAFDKLNPQGTIKAKPGEAVAVPYTFTVNTARTGLSPLDSRIVDYVDTKVFNISDLAAIPVTGRYDQSDLDASHFVLTQDAEGNLVIELSQKGKDLVGTLAAGKIWSVNIELMTHPLGSKLPVPSSETIDITNKATLFGADGDAEYWSEDGSRATSFGDEAEVRKHIYDRGATNWSKTLQAAADADGNLIQPVYVYRVQVLGHGSFGGVKILDINDMLPAATKFLGFVTEENIATGANPTAGPVDIGANLQASFDATAGDSGTVTLSQKSETFPKGGEAAAFFAVEVIDGEKPIVNSIGDIEAKIVPVGPASIDIEKWNDEGEAPEYGDKGELLNDGYEGDFDKAPGKALNPKQSLVINFTVSNDGPDALKDIVVSDTLDSGKGEIKDLVCVFPDDSEGTTWDGPFLPATQFDCTGTLPALQPGETHADTAKVTGTGIVTGLKVGDEDKWFGGVKAADKPLSDTGSNSMAWLAAVAGVLVVAGGVLLLIRRRVAAE